MNIGFLFWFDATPKRTVQEKIIEAALYYRRKFDTQPTLCLVNPNELPADPEDKTATLAEMEAPDHIKVTVRPWKSVLPNHIWIGREDEAVLVTESTEQVER